MAVNFDFCRSQPNIVYLSTYGQWKDTHGHMICNSDSINKLVDYNDPLGYTKFNLFKSTDGGVNWTDVSPEVAGASGQISSIAVNPGDPNQVWITYSGYANNNGSNQNVYRSTDGGNTWNNYSTGLPLGNTEKIVYDESSSNDRLFLAMESGIFYRTNNIGSWYCYDNGLPFTDVRDIDLSYCSGKLYAATYGRGIWETDIVADLGSYTPRETTTITANTTWSSSKTLTGSIRVKTGATLTLSGTGTTVYMPRNARIIVEKGAKLVVSGAKITNQCTSCTWSGIELQGDPTKASNAAYQGSVSLSDSAVIENALTGVCNYDKSGPGYGGGIIVAANSTFHNCSRAVELADYPSYSYATGTATSNCSFNHISFIYEDTTIPLNPGYFTSWNTLGGVLVQSCTFRNAVPLSQLLQRNRGKAIYTEATGMRVSNCTFDGFEQGVHCEGYTGVPTRTVRIYQSQFNHITDNILFAGTAYGDIKGNHIGNMYGSPTGAAGVIRNGNGIYLDNAPGANIGCDNTIDGNTNDPVAPGTGRYGIIINNSNKAATTVIDNAVVHTYIATQTQNLNGNLHIFCNDYENNQYAWAINPQSAGGIFTDQGTGCGATDIRAGNLFVSNLHDIASYLSSNWRYYAGNGSISETPTGVSGLVTVTSCTTNANTQCGQAANCAYNWTTSLQGTALNQYSTLKTAGNQYRGDGTLLYGQIIRGYNSLQDPEGLQSFLESENDDRSRRLLIPLYLEKGLYTNMTTTITALKLPAREKSAYSSYYNLLENLQASGRRPDSLHTDELLLVHQLAADTLEVSAFAKGLLDWSYGEAWAHDIEPLPAGAQMLPSVTPGSAADDAVSRLFTAVPNPTDNHTVIRAFVTVADGERQPVLVIYNGQGHEVFRQPLQAGSNTVDLNTSHWTAGLYLYSLMVNNHVLDTKKLSVVK